RTSGGAIQLGTDPGLRRRPHQTLLRSVEATLKPEVIAVLRRRVDILAIDPDRGRAEEPLALGVLGGLDPTQLDLLVDPLARQQLQEPRQQLRVARAAVEVEELDPHDLSPSPEASASPRDRVHTIQAT